MSDEDICGAETTDGGKCQRPMGWGTDSDIGPCSDHRSRGRPSKFNDERARAACRAARGARSKRGCARAAGIGKSTLNRWVEKNPTFRTESGERAEFRDAFRRARSDGEQLLVEGGLRPERPDGESDIDSQHCRFLLATSYGYEKTERRDVRVDNDADLDEQPDVLVIGGDDDESEGDDE